LNPPAGGNNRSKNRD